MRQKSSGRFDGGSVKAANFDLVRFRDSGLGLGMTDVCARRKFREE